MISPYTTFDNSSAAHRKRYREALYSRGYTHPYYHYPKTKERYTLSLYSDALVVGGSPCHLAALRSCP